MKKQIASVLIAGLALLGILLAWANAVEPPNDWPARILAAAVVFAAPLTIQVLKKRHQARTLEQAEGSFEREVSVRAQSAAYLDALVILVLALALVAIFGQSLTATMVMMGAVVLVILSFWIRYQQTKHAFLSETVDEKSHS